MKNLYEIKDYDVLAGTSIKDAIKEALEKAISENCIVRFDFNGVVMKVYDFDNIILLVDYYNRRLREK
jgi:hypothetical protein